MKDYSGPSDLPTPTKALPGTYSKQIILQKRAKQGLALHHPEDARFTDDVNKVVSQRIMQIKEDYFTEKESALYKKAIEELSLYLCEGQVSLEEYEVFVRDML